MVARNRSKHATQGSIFARSSTEKNYEQNNWYGTLNCSHRTGDFGTQNLGVPGNFFSSCKLSFRHDVQENISDKLREV